MGGVDALAEAIARAARELPRKQALRLAGALAAEPGPPTPAARARLARLVPTPAFERAARRVLAYWGAAGGEAIAVGLRAAAEAVAAARAEQRVDVVWTGPQTPAVPVRLTSAVLVDVVRAAQQRLIVVSFAAYKVEAVVAELARAAARGVDVRLVLETAAAGGGTLAVDAAAAFAPLAGTASFWHWPVERRPVLPAGHAALHAKGAVADTHTALVTSANLTGHGISENMELGLLVQGGPVPRRLAEHFLHLMAAGVLARVPRGAFPGAPRG